MDTERTIHHYRDAGAWPAEQALTAMLDNQFNAFAAVRLGLFQLRSRPLQRPSDCGTVAG